MLLFVLLSFLPLSTSLVVFTGVIPHGDFAYDPQLIHNANGSLALHRASFQLAEGLKEARPDVLLLSTPHGVTASRDFVFFANSEAEGYADIGRDLHDPSVTPYRVPLHLHVECQLVATLVQQLTASTGNGAAPGSLLLPQ